MKTRKITLMYWKPSLPVNNNMLCFVGCTEAESFWLHSVKCIHVGKQNIARIELQFFSSPRNESTLDFFKHFQVIKRDSILFTSVLKNPIEKFVKEKGLQEGEGPHLDVLYLNLPLHGDSFVDSSIEAVRCFGRILGNWCSWCTRLEVTQSTEVWHNGKWVSFSRYLLFKHGSLPENLLK